MSDVAMPFLPPQLEEKIVTLAAWISRQDCAALRLVSNRFTTWANARHYYSVTWSADRSPNEWTSLLSNRRHIRVLLLKPPFWRINSVKTEEIDEQTRELISASPNLLHLGAPWGIFERNSSYIGILPLRTLCLFWSSLEETPTSIPPLSCLRRPEHIYHLIFHAPRDLYDPHDPWVGSAWALLRPSDVARFPSLTTLTYACDTVPIGIEELAKDERIQMIVYAQLEVATIDPLMCEYLEHPRLVARLVPTMMDLHLEWMAQCEGRENMWSNLSLKTAP